MALAILVFDPEFGFFPLCASGLKFLIPSDIITYEINKTLPGVISLYSYKIKMFSIVHGITIPPTG
jgi:hypothetical protein